MALPTVDNRKVTQADIPYPEVSRCWIRTAGLGVIWVRESSLRRTAGVHWNCGPARARGIEPSHAHSARAARHGLSDDRRSSTGQRSEVPCQQVAGPVGEAQDTKLDSVGSAMPHKNHGRRTEARPDRAPNQLHCRCPARYSMIVHPAGHCARAFAKAFTVIRGCQYLSEIPVAIGHHSGSHDGLQVCSLPTTIVKRQVGRSW